MRIPKDIPLATYIRRLISENKLEKFYKSDDWLELRAEVLRDFHYECQECLKRGEYVRADCVHHRLEVRQHPSMALSKYYVDSKGQRQNNLVPLCNQCHNREHPEKNFRRKDKVRFSNEELW